MTGRYLLRGDLTIRVGPAKMMKREKSRQGEQAQT